MKRTSFVALMAAVALVYASLSFAATATSTATKPATAATAAMHAKPAAAATLIDLNSADKAELLKLPGVGEVTAEKIIKARPFSNKSQLVSKGIVGQKVYSKISGMVIAKQK
jgi:DNA uptake protein ComE-like DNA-binding protein